MAEPEEESKKKINSGTVLFLRHEYTDLLVEKIEIADQTPDCKLDMEKNQDEGDSDHQM